MNSQVVLYLAGITVLVAVQAALFISRRQGRVSFRESPAETVSWTPWQLLLASFLTLFAELALIRWIAVEVRIFAYFKNLALLLCFLGFGLGCALARKGLWWKNAIVAFLGLLVIVRLPWRGEEAMEGLSQTLGAATNIQIWQVATSWNWLNFVMAAILTFILLLLVTFIFVPLGQIVSRQINAAPRVLFAYSLNLVGSLAGILIFLGSSRAMLPPSLWLGLVMAGYAILQSEPRDRKMVMILVAPVVLMLYQPIESDRFTWWTPYQQIEYTRTRDVRGNFYSGEVRVNHTGYQWIYDLSEGFIASHPKLLAEPAQDNPYNLPFRFTTKSPIALIVGSGTGNDLAAALRHDSRFVDAVEIDPAILKLGKQEHPEHPYDSQRVAVHLTDARAFLKRTDQRYDLVLFGLLDSHTQLSDYSNMRIDNFVYTEESFREAKRLLRDDGVMFVKFQVDRPWLLRRLATMMNDVFGKPPIMFRAHSSYSTDATCFVISQSNRIEDALLEDSALAQFVARNRILPKREDVPVTTDDWPYLYQEQKRVPAAFITVGAMVLLLAAVLYLQVPDARQQLPGASFFFFFFMGAGFLLLETMVVSRLALYFGTTWQVNGIVISAMLVSLLASNVVIERSGAQPRILIGLGLLGGLLFAYLLPYQKIPAPATVVGILAAVVFAIPVFFAGLLFSREFGVVGEPDRALGANMLGAVVGGLLENLSFVFGMRSLLLVSIALYSLAIAALVLKKRALSVVSASQLLA